MFKPDQLLQLTLHRDNRYLRRLICQCVRKIGDLSFWRDKG